jgi:hypothetical protein
MPITASVKQAEEVLPSKPWSQDDDQRLLQLVRKTAMTQWEIAQKLGRTEAAGSNRLSIIRKRGAAKTYVEGGRSN